MTASIVSSMVPSSKTTPDFLNSLMLGLRTRAPWRIRPGTSSLIKGVFCKALWEKEEMGEKNDNLCSSSILLAFFCYGATILKLITGITTIQTFKQNNSDVSLYTVRCRGMLHLTLFFLFLSLCFGGCGYCMYAETLWITQSALCSGNKLLENHSKKTKVCITTHRANLLAV